VKVKFFYANGTSWGINWLEVGLRVDQTNGQIYWNSSMQPEEAFSATVAGVDGRTAQWGGQPHNDPFPTMLDPDRFEAERVVYPASAFPMNASLDYGIQQVIDGINALPAGKPFMLGGYSQGAALMSSVYNEIRYGTLTSRQSTFLGGVMFGNPRRQGGHVGTIAGTWDGAWDVAESTTGGHGCFPTSGPYARLANCESKWQEFVYPGDIFSSTGDSATGANWTLAADTFSTLDVADLITYVATGAAPAIVDAINAAFAEGGNTLPMTDANGTDIYMSGSGHVAYPWLPPYGLTGDTCFQAAIRYCHSLADEWATAPILLPPATAGWSTTLVPPTV